MAVKDHSLDDRITEAAKAEFLANGFRKTSLQKIADRAGLTTGALYTRYKGKDDLFCSLVSGLMKNVGAQSVPMREQYTAAGESGSIDQILETIRREESVYLDTLFAYYDECVLFFCRSDGSSVERMLRDMMEKKARDTVEFLKKLARPEADLDGVEFIMEEQFHHYRRILEKGYTREKAISCLKTLSVFQEAGWKALFETLF